MQKLLILPIIFLSLIIPSVAYAEWTKVWKTVRGNILYVDLERIKKHSGKVYYWTLIDYLKPTKAGAISAKSYHEAECGRFRSRFLSVTFYKGAMGSGEITESDNTPEKDWTYPPPDRIDEAVLNAVCNHKN